MSLDNSDLSASAALRVRSAQDERWQRRAYHGDCIVGEDLRLGHTSSLKLGNVQECTLETVFGKASLDFVAAADDQSRAIKGSK